MITNSNHLAQLFFEHRGKAVDKWEQYLGIYARELGPFLAAGKPVRLLEIGVQNGGSLELWAKYLPEGSEIIGVDIDPKVGELEFEGNVTAYVADGTDPAAMLAILGDKTFDIIIDDGSHHSRDIIAAFKLLYPRLANGGKFVIEDLHASYWRDFGGGVRLESSAVEYFKRLADAVNADHFEPDVPISNDEAERLKRLNRMIGCVSFYDSVVVVDNLAAPKTAPYRHLVSGLESPVFDPLPVWRMLPADKIEPILFSEPQKNRVDRGLLERFLEFRSENAGLLAQREQLVAEAAQLEGAIAEQRQQIVERDHQIVARDHEIFDREREIARLNWIKDELRLQAAGFRDRLASTLASTSWRITRPVRSLSYRLAGRGSLVDYSLPAIMSDDYGSEPAPPSAGPAAPSAQEALPILEPLTATQSGTTVAVIYLARSAEGAVSDFEPFIASYRAHDAGIPHDLIIIRKGLIGKYGSQAALALMLEGIPHRSVDVTDDGFDIQAYLKVARDLRHDRVCFLNTFSEIKADGWLMKLNAPLDRFGVGASGATASYESLFSSWVLLTKAIWLTSNNHIRYSPMIAKQYHEFLIGQAPGWMAAGNLQTSWKHRLKWLLQLLNFNGRQQRETEEPAGRWGASPPADRQALDQAFVEHWAKVTDNGAGLFSIRDFKPFPNPHLRSNAFMIRRTLLLDFEFVLDDTKTAASRFESGPDGLPARLGAQGLSLVVVGADGTAYDVADWPKSRTFRMGDQSNILVADNQVRGFSAMSEWHKKLHVRMSWGDYLPGSENGLVDFGVDFPRGSLTLGSPKPEDAAQEERTPAAKLLYSIVIPTHNRVALLRDAVESALRQPPGNWECVVFDNASEDPIGPYVASLGDPRVRYARSDEFLPVTESWNRAIDLAKGDYVTLIGDDDGVVPDYFGKLAGLVDKFQAPDVIYSALFQFFHPMVAPWQRAGYVTDLRNGFFFENRQEAFLLDKSTTRKAVAGSLTLHRNFTFNMQAFAFSRKFLDEVRINGKIFHSPFPDYYLANMVMGMADKIVISPNPLAVAGVSRASFGYTLFNNLEGKGAAMLNAKLREDELFTAVEPHLLPGPAYNTNYILTMAHVAQKLGGAVTTQVDYQRYRRMQIFAVIMAQSRLDWMRAAPGSLVWARLSTAEKAWASYVGLLNWRAKAGGGRAQKVIDSMNNSLNSPGFAAIQMHTVAGRFGRLPELLDALEAGTYPGLA